MLTGATIDIFTDREHIRWGEDFRAKLDEALQATLFFIPILTPTYFTREECRNELRRFATSASKVGLPQLLLSVRYVPVPDLIEDSGDELKAIAARMQYEPWERMRLLDEASADYRAAINRLALRLVELTQELEASGGPAGQGTLAGSAAIATDAGIERVSADGVSPSSTMPASSVVDPIGAAGGQVEAREDAPGLLDRLVDLGPAMQDWGQAVEALPPAIEAFNARFSAATEEMNAANSRPNSFAAKVRIARQLARDIEPELLNLEKRSRDYSTELIRLDPAVRAVIEIASNQVNQAGSRRALEQLVGMIEASKTAVSGMKTAADAAKANEGISRDLRPVLRRFETAMRNIIDGTETLEDWSPLIRDALARMDAEA